MNGKMTIRGKKDNKFYGLLAGNVVVLLVIGFLALRPVVNLLRQHTTQITQAKAEIAALEQKTRDLQRLKEDYPKYEATYAGILDDVPTTRDISGYQTEVEELAKLTSVTIKTIDTSGKTAAKGSTTGANSNTPTVKTTASVGGFPAIDVQMDLTGSYPSLLDFVHRLETMDRITRLTSLDITANPETGAVTANLGVQTLYLPGVSS